MSDDPWPLYGLTIRTPRLELRLPREAELFALARLAGEGVHHPTERPFLTPWTEGSPTDRERSVLRGHWADLAAWEPTAWGLRLAVLLDGQPLGLVALNGRAFPVTREVTTWSWLGLRHHGRGYGTEARTGLLALAFDHLGAHAALTNVFQDNHASQGVSRKLGYQPDGISVDARDGEAVVSDRLRLTRTRWAALDHPAVPVTVTGLTAECRTMFGI
ncbi:GNAT family N-acetyltransferase [Kitasatospora sp. NPDC051853]|uniref:GNAT family N-acetyltransferase n=1 Tax=Kitasatospora sp. NPDC051853 TaxID=3364058 RepID=UPI0037884976